MNSYFMENTDQTINSTKFYHEVVLCLIFYHSWCIPLFLFHLQILGVQYFAFLLELIYALLSYKLFVSLCYYTHSIAKMYYSLIDLTCMCQTLALCCVFGKLEL